MSFPYEGAGISLGYIQCNCCVKMFTHSHLLNYEKLFPKVVVTIYIPTSSLKTMSLFFKCAQFGVVWEMVSHCVLIYISLITKAAHEEK